MAVASITSSERPGTWNGVAYKLRTWEDDVPQGYCELQIDEELMKRPEEQLKTTDFPFLGYSWCACARLTRNGNLVASLVLRDQVPTPAPRCCWTVTLVSKTQYPIRDEGSLHLEQDCQYDGSFQKSDIMNDQGECQCLQYGCLALRFDMRLRSTRNEQFVICRNGPVAYCTWRLKKLYWLCSALTLSRMFAFNGKLWDLRLLERTGHDLTLDLCLTSETDPIYAEFGAIAFNCNIPENSVLKSWKGHLKRYSFQSLYLPFSFDRLERTDYQKNGWLTIGFRLSLPKSKPEFIARMFAFEAYRVSVEVITDRWIKERLKRDGSADIFRIMRTRMYTMSMQESVKTLEQQILNDSGLDTSRTRAWLCAAEKDGIFAGSACLANLSKLDFQLGDLCVYRERDDYFTLTLYLEQESGRPLPRLHKHAAILFCVLLNPAQNKIEYIGSVLVNRQSKLCFVCYDDICRLDERLNTTECLFFVEDHSKEIREITTFQKTMKDSGLTSGNVIIVRPKQENEDISGDRVLQDIQTLRTQNATSSEASVRSDAATSNEDFISRNIPCIVCLEKPQTSGFCHGETVHICACEECARQIYAKVPRRCPICRKPTERLITKIF